MSSSLEETRRIDVDAVLIARRYGEIKQLLQEQSRAAAIDSLARSEYLLRRKNHDLARENSRLKRQLGVCIARYQKMARASAQELDPEPKEVEP